MSTIHSGNSSSQVSSSKSYGKKWDKKKNKDDTSKIFRSYSDEWEKEGKEEEEEDVDEYVGFNDLDKMMDMFRVSFVPNTPLIEYNDSIDDIYQNVVFKLVLLFRYM